MADRVKGIQVEIGGNTSGLNKAIKDANRESNSLQAELKKIDRLLKFDPTNAVLLQQKQELLGKSLEGNKTKLEALQVAQKKVAEQMASGTEINEKQYRALQREIVTTESSIRALDDSAEQANKKTSSLGASLQGIATAAGINVPPALQGLISKLDNVSVSSAALVGILGGAIASLSKMTIDTAQTADNFLTLSITTGMSTDALQEFEYASELLDVSSETMQSSMTKMVKSMDAARNGSANTAEAYKKLKLRITENNGQLRDAQTVYYEAIDALGRVRNETERDAIAMQIFGKSAKELNPLIEAGSGKLKELSKEAHNVGYVMSNDTLQQFGELDDAMQRMSKAGDSLKNSLALALLPVLTKLFEVIGSIPTPVLQLIIVLTSTIATVILAVKAVKEMTSTAGAIKGFFSEFDFAANKTTMIIMGVVAALTALAIAIAVIIGKGNEFKNAMSTVGSTTNQMQGMSKIPGYANGTNYHPGGLAIVGERGPELVNLPRGSKVYPNGSHGGGDTYNITIDAKNIKEFNDIVSITNREKQSYRQGYAW